MSDKYQDSGYYKPTKKKNDNFPKSIGIMLIIFVVVLAYINITYMKMYNKVNAECSQLKKYVFELENQLNQVNNQIVYNNQDVIILIAGQYGEYGKELTYNANTKMPDKTVAYYVPYGKYKVTNIGEYTAQINVCSDKIKIVNGWEEPDNYLHNDLADVGKDLIIDVPENYHIEIAEPTQITLELVE
jgi:hypothetical protein